MVSMTAIAASAWVLAATGAVASPLAKRATLDEFVSSERDIALTNLLCNIGNTGCRASGASAGVVLASPSNNSPDYYYTWTRDAALVFKEIIDSVRDNTDLLLPEIENYVTAQAYVQTVSNPSGSLSDGSGLAEPKFMADLTQFTGSWGRPQRDGPALRATALINYYNYLLENNQTTDCGLWQIIQNDLNYVAQYWPNTGYDLWEEVPGNSFFTVASSYRALVEGSALAEKLGKAHSAYDTVASAILCNLQTFWDSSKGYIVSNVNTASWVSRSGLDSNTPLTATHLFDPALGCDDKTFQPCSSKQLATTKKLVDSFRSIYTVNSGKAAGTALAVGRYAEDTYYNGNPWYLCTLSIAEQLYDSVITWKQQGSITVDSTSQAFFNDLISGIATGTYAAGSDTFDKIISAVTTYADGFVAVVQQYTPSDGSLTEQYARGDGTPLSASHLTWSYAAFLSATDRRAGIVPPTWAPSDVTVPSSCPGTTVSGSYTAASNCGTPGAGDGNSGSGSGSGGGSGSSAAVTFNELATTYYGENIKVVGNTTDFGSWNPSNAILLSANSYTSSNPLWTITKNIPQGSGLEFKFIRVGSDGGITWEDGNNKVITIGASTTSATVSASWNGGYSVSSA